MQDLDIPPQEEGNTNGAVDDVRRGEVRVARWAATARSIRAFLPLPWITATAPIWARIMATATRDEDRAGPVFPRLTRCPILSLYPLRERMRLRAFLRLSKTCSFSARFRKRAAR